MAGEETGRIEAFSDGMFAITLLVLDLRVPPLDKVSWGGLPAAVFVNATVCCAAIVSLAGSFALPDHTPKLPISE